MIRGRTYPVGAFALLAFIASAGAQSLQGDLCTYVGNDPANMTDPLGLAQVCPDNPRNCVEATNEQHKVPDITLSDHDSRTIDSHIDEVKNGNREGDVKFVVGDKLESAMETRTDVVNDAAESAEAKPPSGATAAAHPHPTAGRHITDGIIDQSGQGDSQALEKGLPNVAVNGNRSVVHEAPNGRYRVRMIHGDMTPRERATFIERVDQRQRKLDQYYEANPGD